jgi:hypothetical protein
MGAMETRGAIEAAKAAFPAWAAKTAKERGVILRRWFDLITTITPFFPARESGGIREVIEKRRGLVADAVAVCVFDHFHPAAVRLAVALVKRIVGHLHNPHAALRIPVHEYRILHQRLTRAEFGFESRLHMQRFQRLLRCGN